MDHHGSQAFAYGLAFPLEVSDETSGHGSLQLQSGVTHRQRPRLPETPETPFLAGTMKDLKDLKVSAGRTAS